MATAYQKRMLMRKQTDLTRLADQYKKSVEGLTGEYQSAFANYQKSAAERLAPYEEAVKRYKEQDMPAFERAKADYENRLNQFNQAMSDWEANPKELVNAKISASRGGPAYTINGKTYYGSNLPGEYTVEGNTRDVKSLKVYKDRPAPRMNAGSAPTAPKAPERPQIAAFDSSPFDQKRGQLQQDYTREVGERKSARLNVVRGGRTLMKDA